MEGHVAHAAVFAEALGAAAWHCQGLDLGSGGGVPGLLLAAWLPETRWVLLDVHRRRTSFVTWAVAELGLAGRVSVVRQEATVAGRAAGLRGSCSFVTARSFGPPARTAECGAAFLAAGGRLLVAEPPEAPQQRWPAAKLAELGLEDAHVCSASAGTIRVLRQVSPLDERFPRRRRKMEQQPLW
ncbi:MAG: class I SAM-dependent methyltransferase [Actinobacteria bacterium]|nr:class I SAM-dependent methyltransferase [Actinomycetota bacterium]